MVGLGWNLDFWKVFQCCFSLPLFLVMTHEERRHKDKDFSFGQLCVIWYVITEGLNFVDVIKKDSVLKLQIIK
jgi:hypothetical protein